MLKLRYYQKNAVDSFFEYTKTNWGKHPLIVIPTAGGKSIVQAYIVKHILQFPNTRILLATHQKELIKQNYIELIDNFGNDQLLDTGIYSAGLNCRDTKNRIIFGGIQSIYKKAYELGWFDLIIVDEVQRVPHKNIGTYRKFLSDMIEINKNIVIGGLSATPYRTKGGILCEGEDKLFDDICYEASIKELIDPGHPNNLDKAQYLCELVTENPKHKVDLKGVKIQAGDYAPGQMEKAFRKGDLVCEAVKEIQEHTINRKKVLVFTAGIGHCEEVSAKINNIIGENLARFIHSKQSKDINDRNIEDFKKGVFKYLVNVNVLVEGFNEKSIDCIVLLRSTRSPGLYVQMIGRGFRMFPGKENCLVLDFGKNIEFHGPIDRIEIRTRKDGTRVLETAPMKECPQCHKLCSIAAKECPLCDFIFISEDKPKHEKKASKKDIISKWKKPERLQIVDVFYHRHKKDGKPDSVRVDYCYSDFLKYSEWICLDHGGYAGENAKKWMRERTNLPIQTTSDFLKYQRALRKPSTIIVNLNDSFPRITGHIFDEEIKNLNFEDVKIYGEKRDIVSDKPEVKADNRVKKEISDDEIGRLLF